MTGRRRQERRGPGPTGYGGRWPEEADPSAFRWVVDGHNAIFAVREWEDLQVEGRRREARRALEETLETFGRAVGSRVVLVYDGNHMDLNPDALDGPFLRSEYSQPPEEADDRIRFLVQRLLRDGERPVVVTSDRRTLAHTLPPGARFLPVETFFGRVFPRLVRRPEKWNPEGLEDVERHFLSRSPFAEDRRLADGPGGDPPEAAGTENGPQDPDRGPAGR